MTLCAAHFSRQGKFDDLLFGSQADLERARDIGIQRLATVIRMSPAALQLPCGEVQLAAYKMACCAILPHQFPSLFQSIHSFPMVN